MRPTYTECLVNLKRVLRDVVLPAIDDHYARTQLIHGVDALDDLSRHWDDEITNSIAGIERMLSILKFTRDSVLSNEQSSRYDGILAEIQAALDLAEQIELSTINHERIGVLEISLRSVLVTIIRNLLSEKNDNLSLHELQKRVNDHVRQHVAVNV